MCYFGNHFSDAATQHLNSQYCSYSWCNICHFPQYSWFLAGLMAGFPPYQWNMAIVRFQSPLAPILEPFFHPADFITTISPLLLDDTR